MFYLIDFSSLLTVMWLILVVSFFGVFFFFKLNFNQCLHVINLIQEVEMKTWCRDNWSAIDLIHMARYTRDRMLVCYTCNTNNRVYLYVQN